MRKSISPMIVAAWLCLTLASCRLPEYGGAGGPGGSEDIPQVITNLRRLPTMRLLAGAGDADPREFTAVDDKVYFSAAADASGVRLVYRYTLGTPPDILNPNLVVDDVKGGYRGPERLVGQGPNLYFRGQDVKTNKMALFEVSGLAANSIDQPSGVVDPELLDAWIENGVRTTVWRNGKDLILQHVAGNPPATSIATHTFGNPVASVRGLCEPEDKIAVLAVETAAAAAMWSMWSVDIGANTWVSHDHAGSIDQVCVVDKKAFYAVKSGGSVSPTSPDSMWCVEPSATPKFREITDSVSASIQGWDQPVHFDGKLYFRRGASGAHALWQSDGGSATMVAKLGMITGMTVANGELHVVYPEFGGKTGILRVDTSGTISTVTLSGLGSPQGAVPFWGGIAFFGVVPNYWSPDLPAIAYWRPTSPSVWRVAPIPGCIDEKTLTDLLGVDHLGNHELLFAGSHSTYGNEAWRWRGL